MNISGGLGVGGDNLYLRFRLFNNLRVKIIELNKA